MSLIESSLPKNWLAKCFHGWGWGWDGLIGYKANVSPEKLKLADIWLELSLATRNDEVRNNESSDQDENHQGVRRSKREHKQRIKISPDEIGECDDENDKDYK